MSYRAFPRQGKPLEFALAPSLSLNADPTITALAVQLVELITAQVRANLQPTPRQQAAQKRLLNAAESGEYIGRTEQAVRHLIHQRDLPVVRKGRSVRIDRKDLDIWIENNKC